MWGERPSSETARGWRSSASGVTSGLARASFMSWSHSPWEACWNLRFNRASRSFRVSAPWGRPKTSLGKTKNRSLWSGPSWSRGAGFSSRVWQMFCHRPTKSLGMCRSVAIVVPANVHMSCHRHGPGPSGGTYPSSDGERVWLWVSGGGRSHCYWIAPGAWHVFRYLGWAILWGGSFLSSPPGRARGTGFPFELGNGQGCGHGGGLLFPGKGGGSLGLACVDLSHSGPGPWWFFHACNSSTAWPWDSGVISWPYRVSQSSSAAAIVGRVDALSGGLACTAHNHLSPFFPRRSQWVSPLQAFDVRVISSSLGGEWAATSGRPSLGGASVIALSCEFCRGASLGGGPGLDASPTRTLAKACVGLEWNNLLNDSREMFFLLFLWNLLPKKFQRPLKIRFLLFPQQRSHERQEWTQKNRSSDCIHSFFWNLLFSEDFSFLVTFLLVTFRGSFVAFPWLFRGPHLLGKQCLGVFFVVFFVFFSWLFRGPPFGQILRVLALEKSSESLFPHFCWLGCLLEIHHKTKK